MENFTAERKAWYQRQQENKQQRQQQFLEKQVEAEKQRQAAEGKRKQAEEQARRKAEAEKTAEEKRQAELAMMNPIERQVAEFVTTLDAIKSLESGHWNEDEISHASSHVYQGKNAAGKNLA